MIIVHFFLREIKKKHVYLMADSSATEGTNPLWSSAEVIFEVNPGEKREQWIERAKKHIMGVHPELKYLRTLKPRTRKNSPPTFDLLFEYKPQKSLLQKIGIKK